MQRAMGPVRYQRLFATQGDPAEYAFARVPAADDRGWADVAATAIDFRETSALCGRTCRCLDGGEFTCFQIFADVASLVAAITAVDDGARVTVFNAAAPGGVTDPAAYVRLAGARVTDDLARYAGGGAQPRSHHAPRRLLLDAHARGRHAAAQRRAAGAVPLSRCRARCMLTRQTR